MAERLRSAMSTPAEVQAAPLDTRAYEHWRAADTLRAPYNVPTALLEHIRPDAVDAIHECPLLCFVNARSGGRKGMELALALSRAIGRVQVFDIAEKDQRPDRVLGRLYEVLRTREAAGDSQATLVRQRLRLLVCGGDGTIAWVMGVIKKLRLQPEPPVAMIPLGTGNDLSRTFMWGPAYDPTCMKGHKKTYKTLNSVAVAREDKLDCWNITVTTPHKHMFGNSMPHSLSPPLPPALPPAAAAAASGLMTPPPRPSGTAAAGSVASAATGTLGRGQSSGLHPAVQAARDSLVVAAGDRSVAASVAATMGSATPLQNIATSSVGSAATTFTTATNMSLHTGAAQAGTSLPPTIVSGGMSTSAEDEAGIGVMGGMFWNYFSVGLDAKAAWSFHSLREEKPALASSRAANQFWYSAFSCTSGWFCCAQPLRVKVNLEVLAPGPRGEAAGWQPVKIPKGVRALVVLNLQSYAGGRNLWGPNTSEADEKKHGFKKPSYNDGLLEVVGLLSGWHAGLVMASKGGLLHAKRICQAAGVRVALSAPYVRADGEPSHCYMQLDGEPWKQDIPVKGADAPVRVEIVHAGVSRVLRNEPMKRQATGGSNTGGGQDASSGGRGLKSSSRSNTATGPLVSAVSEPSVLPVHASAPASQSQQSIQLVGQAVAAAQPHGQGQPASGPLPGPLPPSAFAAPYSGGAVVGAAGAAAPHAVGLHTSAAPGKGPEAGAALFPRVGSAAGGRPSTAASVAGSSTTAGGELSVSDVPVVVGGGAGGTRTTASSKPGEVIDTANGSGSPRTVSVGSHSGPQVTGQD
ncbi:hypothetical protein CHLRE_07g325550v5 [Chlamydomonas reinhardtii]|uniref:Diacylglycerol kinase n=1 Tax=Chlamydomonas reinhardtii TaxID=3055 RepID=A0A2K3DJB5_CHLRE|nr:uncharacterized protein CHLRE_07g325550v5 [Chlamydomonas reinhardtii]PNW80627.1 hypothetical protein CHLRE_07g325550v5 [Chlamydomonas reinhardtii]